MPTVNFHELEDIEGIGPALASALRGLDFHTTEDLLRRASLSIARDMARVNGISLVQALTQYIPQARLLRLDMPAQAAEAFVSHGITTYRQITRLGLAKVQEIANEALADSVSCETAANWISAAGARAGTGTLHLSVFDQMGAPIENARIEILDPTDRYPRGTWVWRSNEHGVALIESVLPGLHSAVVQFDGHSDATVPFEAHSDGNFAVRVYLNEGNKIADEIDEFKAELLTDFSLPVDRIKIPALSALPFIPILHVIGEVDSEVEVASTLFRRRRRNIELYWTRLDVADVPSGTKVGDFLYDDEGQLKTAAFKSMDEVRKAWESTFFE